MVTDAGKAGMEVARQASVGALFSMSLLTVFGYFSLVVWILAALWQHCSGAYSANIRGHMSSYVEKLLPILIYPLGLALLLCITAFALSFASRAHALRVSIAVAVIVLWLASTPAFAGLLTVILEYQNPPVPIETISPKDVVIVLGGGLAQQPIWGPPATA